MSLFDTGAEFPLVNSQKTREVPTTFTLFLLAKEEAG